MKRTLLVILTAVLCTLSIYKQLPSISTANYTSPPFSNKRVLFISSYSPSFGSFFDQVKGMQEVFDQEDVLLEVQYMDSKNFNTKDNIDNFRKALSYKLENAIPFDAVIVGDDNALRFVLNNRQLFPELPIVFLGINDLAFADQAASDPMITGIKEALSIRGTVELAKRLKPNSDYVYVLVDNTVSSDAIMIEFDQLNFDDLDLLKKKINVGTMSYDEFEKELSTISEEDILLYISLNQDKNGEIKGFQESIKVALGASNQPIFSLVDHAIDYGLIGGEVVSFSSQGRIAANMVISYFQENNFDSAPVVENSLEKIIDYSQVEYYELDTLNLPTDVIFINQKDNTIARLIPTAVLVLIIVVIQSYMILSLRKNIHIRKQAQAKLMENKESLLVKNDELSVLNEEISAANDELRDSYFQLEEAFKENEKQKYEIFSLANIDQLTRLRNRDSMMDLIGSSLDPSISNMIYAVFFLDLDNFKYINDTFGHDFGDLVLKETAAKLSSLKSMNLEAGRFGGDEFLLFLRLPDRKDLKRFIREIENLFQSPYALNDKTFFVTISMGISLFPDHGHTGKDLIQKADLALYKSKDTGKNKTTVFSQSLTNAIQDKIFFQTHIRRAFNNLEFHLSYQPVYNLEKEGFYSVEALIRWHSDILGYVSPLKLIQASEEMGLIVEIGQWVIEESMRFSRRINELTNDPVTVNINISAIQLMNPDFMDKLDDLIGKTRVDPTTICFEMTESTLLTYSDHEKNIMDHLSNLGIKLALDDFGTGYSSLSYFKILPATIVKIDKTFIDHISNDTFDQYMVKSVIDLSHQKGHTVIAEGVENQDQATLLRQYNCDCIQGYYYSKPLSEKDTIALFSKK